MRRCGLGERRCGAEGAATAAGYPFAPAGGRHPRAQLCLPILHQQDCATAGYPLRLSSLSSRTFSLRARSSLTLDGTGSRLAPAGWGSAPPKTCMSSSPRIRLLSVNDPPSPRRASSRMRAIRPGEGAAARTRRRGRPARFGASVPTSAQIATVAVVQISTRNGAHYERHRKVCLPI